jgi:hypothetical protein
MAWRLCKSVVRGEIDNRERDQVRGSILLVGQSTPISLRLSGNCVRDLAGCHLRFENPNYSKTDEEQTNLSVEQTGPVGEITAARKVRVFDLPLEEALQLIREGKQPPEHLAAALYIEWFSESNGRVVVESTDYTVQVSAPAWKLSPEEEQKQISATHEAVREWLDRMDRAKEMERARNFDPEQEKPLDEFGYEKFMRESDARTDKYMELLQKYEGHPDCERIVAREMGWEWLEEALEADERGALPSREEFEAPPLEPNPATEGVDWIRDADGRIHHPLTKRAFESVMAMWHYCDEHNLLGDDGDGDLQEMLFEFQTAGAKLAGALDSLAYDEDGSRDGGFVVAALKRALNYVHKSIAAAERVEPKNLIPSDKMKPYREDLFEIREEVLALMQRFREKQN